MNVMFLGTGAADRMNLPQEDNFNDYDKRRCSMALLDGKVLLDCGAHALNSLKVANIHLNCITDIVFTHLHPDHFDLNAVKTIAENKNSPLNLWVRDDGVIPNISNCVIHPMQLFCEYSISDYKITGVPANHQEYPQHLSIEKDNKKFFYGLDGAWLLGDTVRYMQNKHYNTVILDATVGDYSGDYRMGEHNSIPMLRLMTDSMKTLNIIDDKTDVILSHLAVCLHKSYYETCDIVKKDNYIVAYDGMKIEI